MLHSSSLDVRGELTSPGVGVDSFKAGPGAAAGGLRSIAIGASAGTGTAVGGVAIGYATVADQDTAVALGYVSKAYAQSAVAIGNNAQVQVGATDAIGIGKTTDIEGVASVGIGAEVSTFYDFGIGIGKWAWIDGLESIGLGYQANIDESDYSVAVGTGAGMSTSDYSVSAGYQAYVDSGSPRSVAIGAFAYVDQNIPDCTVAGYDAYSYSEEGTVFGGGAHISTNSIDAISIGYQAQVGANSPRCVIVGSNGQIASGAPDSTLVGDDSTITTSGSAGGVAVGSAVNVPNGTIGIGVNIAGAITSQPSDSVVIGLNPVSMAGGGVVSVGNHQELSGGTNATVVGTGCIATRSYSTCVGFEAECTGSSTPIAIGAWALAQHNGAIVVGVGAESEEDGFICWIGSQAGGANYDLRVSGSIQSAANEQGGDATTLQSHAESQLTGLTGASITFTDLIPAGVVVLGVTARIKSLVTGATGWDLGDGVTQNRWASNKSVADETASDLTDSSDTSPPIFTAAQDVVVTALGSDFTGGTIRVTVHYIQPIAGPN